MQIGRFRQSKILFYRELKSEWRNRYAINGILVQLVASVFICYLSFAQIKPMTWNALFWVIILFSSVNAIARSFVQERSGRLLYFHSLVSPIAVYYSKLMLNVLVTLIISFMGYLVFNLLLGPMNWDQWLFMALVIGFGIGTAGLFTMVSAIASKTRSGSILMPMLSFPLIIPLLLVGISAAAGLVLNQPENFERSLGVLLLIDAMIIGLGVILFRFLWQD